MELIPGQNNTVFLDDFVVEDRGDVSGIDMGKDDEGRGRQAFRYQCGHEDVGVDDRKQFTVHF